VDDLEQTLQDCHQLLLVIEQGSVNWSGRLRHGTACNERPSRTTLHQPLERETNGNCHYLQEPLNPPDLGKPPQEVVDAEDQARQLPWIQHLI